MVQALRKLCCTGILLAFAMFFFVFSLTGCNKFPTEDIDQDSSTEIVDDDPNNGDGRTYADDGDDEENKENDKGKDKEEDDDDDDDNDDDEDKKEDDDDKKNGEEETTETRVSLVVRLESGNSKLLDNGDCLFACLSDQQIAITFLEISVKSETFSNFIIQVPDGIELLMLFGIHYFIFENSGEFEIKISAASRLDVSLAILLIVQ